MADEVKRGKREGELGYLLPGQQTKRSNHTQSKRTNWGMGGQKEERGVVNVRVCVRLT